MSENNRVVITGIGALSPIGNDAETTWQNALKGVNGIDTITRIDTENYNVHLAGELKILISKTTSIKRSTPYG